MGAIFISYTGRDPEGNAWADRLAEWFREWNYGYFRDKDHSHGIKAGEEWSPALYRALGLAQAMVCLCSQQYESSPWCVGEVAIAVKDGKIMIPLHLLRPQDAPEGECKSHPLPSMLQTRQAIQVANALQPSPEQLKDAKHRLHEVLNKSLKWRQLQEWDPERSPYPGLPAFEAEQAPVFFGRDADMLRVVQQLTRLALSAPGFLLLLGASGTGKSSLVRAGVVPRLRADRERRWLVLEPFKPGLDPFGALRSVLRKPLAAAKPAVKEPQDGDGEAAGLNRQLHSLSGAAQAPVVLLIDQFEALLADGNHAGERFLAFLQGLLSTALAEVVVLATMRSDFLAPLQSRRPDLFGKATTITEPLNPIRLEDFGELISGPAKRSNLELQPGLRERLVSDSGDSDALPLLAFTLEKLWQKWKDRGGPIVSTRGERWDLTVADYEALGGVAGAVSSQAKLCWDPQTGSEADAAALRQAFVNHLVTLNEEGVAAKRAALLQELPERSRPIVERLVNRRLLVSDAGVVEIAHEKLLSTWEPLVGWIEEGRKQLEQRRRVARLSGDLALKQPLEARLAALLGLLVLAEADLGAVVPPAVALGVVLTHPEGDPREWLLAIQLLGLVGGDSAVAALSTFLEQRQIPELLETALAVPRLEALCKAAAALQRIHCRTPPVEKDEARWLLLLSATVRDDGGAVRSELMRLRLWATPRLEAPGAWVEPLGEGVALTMVAIPAGRFVMGSPPEEEHRSDNEGPQPLVELEGFWMGQTPITQAQWRQVMGELPAPPRWPQTPESNPSDFSDKSDRDQHPVEWVNCHDATGFCKRLSQQTGRCYTLPSEAQWEYACRAGTVTPFFFGNTITPSLANYRGNSTYANGLEGEYRRKTTPVGLFPANAWGLHDLHGNVWEWCAGRPWLDGNKKKRKRVLRGGSWFNGAEDCRSARRCLVHPGMRFEHIGFRVCCLPQG